MMTLEDYALDVGKSIEEIKELCDKIGINYKDETTTLDETSIILLDNEIIDKVCAKGNFYAEVWYEVNIKIPLNYNEKTKTGKKRKNISLY